jgi:hypothetical protein
VRPYTNDETKRIAEECREFLAAHQRRSGEATTMTPREQEALQALRYAIAVREREALAAAMGTAA